MAAGWEKSANVRLGDEGVESVAFAIPACIACSCACENIYRGTSIYTYIHTYIHLLHIDMRACPLRFLYLVA